MPGLAGVVRQDDGAAFVEARIDCSHQALLRIGTDVTGVFLVHAQQLLTARNEARLHRGAAGFVGIERADDLVFGVDKAAHRAAAAVSGAARRIYERAEKAYHEAEKKMGPQAGTKKKAKKKAEKKAKRKGTKTDGRP